LFRRATSSAQGASKAELAELTQQVTQDRQALLTLMHHLTVPVQHYKVAAGWALEKGSAGSKTGGNLLPEAEKNRACTPARALNGPPEPGADRRHTAAGSNARRVSALCPGSRKRT